MKIIGAELNLVPYKVFETNHNLEKAQKYFTLQVYKESEPYTPKKNGILSSNVIVGNDFIHYKSPYANYMWNGKKFIDPKYEIGAFFNENYGFWSRPGILKKETDIPLNYNGAPLRGSFWINRMWADKSDVILNKVQKFIDKGGK